MVSVMVSLLLFDGIWLFPGAIQAMGQGVAADGQLPLYLGFWPSSLLSLQPWSGHAGRRIINLEQQRKIQGGRRVWRT